MTTIRRDLIVGTITMKIMSTTSITSIIGVTLISARGSVGEPH